MRCKAFLLFLLFVSVSKAETSPDFWIDLRYQLLRSRTDELVETFGLRFDGEDARLRIYTRMNHAGFNWTAFDYALEGQYSLLSWMSFQSRLLHRNRLAEVSSTTSLMGTVRLEGHFPEFLSYFIEFGVYGRRHRVLGNSILPIVVSASFNEWDYALAVGGRIHFSKASHVQLQLATLESVDIYNLNDPYVEAATTFPLGQTTTNIYLRYQALLGFGLSDAWVAGVSFVIPDSAVTEPSSTGNSLESHSRILGQRSNL